MEALPPTPSSRAWGPAKASAPPRHPLPPPSLPPPRGKRATSFPLPPPHPTRGTATGLPPPARGCGWVCTACMAGRYAELSGQPSCAPQAACEPQDWPSNQIKSPYCAPSPSLPRVVPPPPSLPRVVPPPPPSPALCPPPPPFPCGVPFCRKSNSPQPCASSRGGGAAGTAPGCAV